MINTKTTDKRPACDRCRSRKLRCLRPDDSQDDACSRCVRFNVECVTRAPRRPGRPRKITQPDIATSPLQLSEELYLSGSFTTPSTASSHVDSNDTSCFDASYGTIYFDSSYDMSEYLIPEDICDPFSKQIQVPCIPSELEDPQGFSASCSTTTAAPALSPVQELCRTPSVAEDSNLPAQHTSRACRLADLYRELCLQCTALESTEWDIYAAVRLSLEQNRYAANTTRPSSASDPLASIFKSSSEFISLLTSISSAATTPPLEPPRQPMHQNTTSTPHATVTEPWILLSCYIEIVTVYDRIFEKFNHLVDRGDQSSNAEPLPFANGMKLYLGAVAVPASLSTLSHLLYCLVENQLGVIETLLGLPSDFCVTIRTIRSPSDRPPGIFSNQNALPLMMLSKQTDGTNSTRYVGAIGAIESLRNRMQSALHIR